MEDMIQQLVEADHRAQAIVDEAKQVRKNADKELIVKRRELADEAKKRADAEIEAKTQELRRAAEENWKQTEDKYSRVLQKLREDYSRNQESWVSSIVGQVLGK